MTPPRTQNLPEAAGHRLYALDGLRAVAVTGVILRHYAQSHCYGGLLGVDLLFVLSGYLITRLLVQEFEASGSIRFDLFYLRRACRLLPAVLLMLTVVTSLRMLMHVTFASPYSWWFSDLAMLFFIANYFMLEALGPTWSLSVEEQFYFLWPMALLTLLRRCHLIGTRIAIAGVLALAGTALRAWMNHHPIPGLDVYFFLFTRIDTLLIGAMLALAEGLPGFSAAWTRICQFRPAEMAMVIFVAAVLLLKDGTMHVMFDGGWTLMAIVFAVLIGSSIYEPRRTLLKRFLEWHPVVWVGRRSYGIYLYYMPVFVFLKPMYAKYPSFAGQVAHVCLGLILPVVLAAISYRYVELPFLKRKVHLKWNFVKPEPVVPSALPARL